MVEKEIVYGVIFKQQSNILSEKIFGLFFDLMAFENLWGGRPK